MVDDTERSESTKIQRESGITFSPFMSFSLRMDSVVVVHICFTHNIDVDSKTIAEIIFSDRTYAESDRSICLGDFIPLPRMMITGLFEAERLSETDTGIYLRAETGVFLCPLVDVEDSISEDVHTMELVRETLGGIVQFGLFVVGSTHVLAITYRKSYTEGLADIITEGETSLICKKIGCVTLSGIGVDILVDREHRTTLDSNVPSPRIIEPILGENRYGPQEEGYHQSS